MHAEYTDKDPQTVGEFLRQLRIHAQLSQRALARLIGIDIAYVNRIELDKERPSEEILARIAASLELEDGDTLALFALNRQLPPNWSLPRLQELKNLSVHFRPRPKIKR